MRHFAERLATRYNRARIEMMLAQAPGVAAPVSAPDPAPLLEQLATRRLENSALRLVRANAPMASKERPDGYQRYRGVCLVG